jgi:MFS family permease
MLRSVGALIFGMISDRYGRKWPMVINLALFVVLELGAGFCQTLGQFIALRCLYGIAMGGMVYLSDFRPSTAYTSYRFIWTGGGNGVGRPTI